MMLAAALQDKINGGELGREATSKATMVFRKEELLIGRQVTHLLCEHLGLSETMSMVCTITDLCNQKWRGDTLEQVSQLKGLWEEILDNMGTSLDRPTRTDLRVDQISQSKEVDSEVKAFYREPDKKTYSFLMACVERCLSLSRMKETGNSSRLSR